MDFSGMFIAFSGFLPSFLGEFYSLFFVHLKISDVFFMDFSSLFRFS